MKPIPFTEEEQKAFDEANASLNPKRYKLLEKACNIMHDNRMEVLEGTFSLPANTLMQFQIWLGAALAAKILAQQIRTLTGVPDQLYINYMNF